MRLRFLLFFMVCCACKEFNLKKINESTLVEEELKNINWNSVDEYPTFETCDSTSNQSPESCFKKILVGHINEALSKANIVITEDINDTIMLRLQIDDQGKISIPDIEAKSTTREAIPSLDSLMRDCLSDLPKVYPAIKRGQQVSTEFQLPVVVVIK